MNAHNIRVLAIEDSALDCALIQEYLTGGGEQSFLLECVDCLATGLERLAQGQADVVLLDLSLPDSQGLETLDRLLLSAPMLPVVILTDRPDDDLGLEALRRGAQDYLHKGHFSAREIKRAIRYSFERCSSIKELEKHTAQLRLLTEQFPAILWTTDKELRITSSFGMDLRQINLKPGQLVGTKLQDYLQTSDPTSLPLASHLEALKGNKAAYDLEWMGRLLQVRIEPLHQAEHVVGVIGVALDVTEQRQVETGFHLAQQIQQGLLPRSMPVLAGFDVGGIMSPIEATGGDFFDFIPQRDGSLVIGVGDASGHGFGPALLAAAIHASLHVLTLSAQSCGIDAMLSASNRLLCLDAHRESFVTLLLTRLDVQARSLTWANAGHPSGLVLDSSDQVKARLTSCALPLGVNQDEVFTTSSAIALQSGDTVLLVTDGVLEVKSAEGNLFGMERLLEVFRSRRHLSAQEIATGICHSAREFSQPGAQLDDYTVVVVKVT